MFVLLWGPTVAAVSVVLDHDDAGAIVSTALGGLLHAARIAAFHHVDEVGWNLQTGRLGEWHRMRAATACPTLLPGYSPSYARLLARPCEGPGHLAIFWPECPRAKSLKPFSLS